ncbi:hypothetical protein FGB62_397g03 [Gracilaria domingensis]|nr:hypothetical protein FGB62_397g03 [Gracilaria domingensis]
MLEFSCQLKNYECAAEALKQMSVQSQNECTNSSWRTSSFGCSSERQIKAIGDAIIIFGWERIGTTVIKIIECTPVEKFAHAFNFVSKAQRYGLKGEDLNAIKEALMGLLWSEGYHRSLVSTAKFVYSFSFCRERRSEFLANAKTLPIASIVEVIQGIAAALEETGEYDHAMKGLTALIEEYVPKAVHEFCRVRRVCGNRKLYPYLFFDEDSDIGESLLKVLSIVVRWRHTNEYLVRFLVENALSAGSLRLLKVLAQCDRLSTAVDDNNVRKLLRALMERLEYPKPLQNNRQSHAHVPGHDEITCFLRGDRLNFTVGGFAGAGEARDFVQGRFYREYNEVEQHSVSAEIVGRGSETTVILQKTEYYYLHQLKLYEED